MIGLEPSIKQVTVCVYVGLCFTDTKRYMVALDRFKQLTILHVCCSNNLGQCVEL